MRVLKHILRFTNAGLEFEPDQRHAEIIAAEMGFSHANSVTTPWDHDGEKKRTNGDDDNDYRDPESAAKYGLIASHMNYISPD